jgi:hypothetical protein
LAKERLFLAEIRTLNPKHNRGQYLDRMVRTSLAVLGCLGYPAHLLVISTLASNYDEVPLNLVKTLRSIKTTLA